jgi:hypothetical protein
MGMISLLYLVNMKRLAMLITPYGCYGEALIRERDMFMSDRVLVATQLRTEAQTQRTGCVIQDVCRQTDLV